MYLSDRYPQLSLPAEAGMRNTQLYKARVLRGEPIPEKDRFFLLPGESITRELTPAGAAEILLIPDRERFVYCYRALAFRCEPEPVPDTVGAVCINGLINWEKIQAHRQAYLAEGGTDWNEEFRRFTAEKTNYTDSLIVLSGGPYSGLNAGRVGLPEEEWRDKSVTIRKFHELTHFVMRKLYPEDKDTVRDEVLADLIGVYAAFGACEAAPVRLFLGIEDGAFNGAGRLSYYSGADSIRADALRAEEFLRLYAGRLEKLSKEAPLEMLLRIFP